MGDLLAIEIKKESLVPLVTGLFPELAGISFGAVKGHFLVFGLPNSSGTNPVPTLLPPPAVGVHFDHVENYDEVMIKKMVGKEE